MPSIAAMKKRILIFLLCLTMIMGFFPMLIAPASPTALAATTNQNNIVARADYLYDITWVCMKTVPGWRGNYTFYQGSTYRIPYGQPINSGAYIGFGVSVDTFVESTKSASSVFYTSQSTYGSTYSVYYATDCSAFVSWCWGASRHTTYSIPQISTYIGMATAANASMLQLGDALNSNDVGHVVLVTGLTYNSSGTLTQIEITEQTPPQLKRSYYTPTELGNKYGTYYGIYRYTGTVPAAPSSSGSSDSSSSVTGKYYPACDSSYTTFYAAMESIGVSCDWDLHCRIAEKNGISDFTGTAEQNTSLLNLLKAGKLLNPDYVAVSYYPACDSSYTTFYAAMESIGVSCDWDLHCRIAQANGITDFTGTAEQNTSLLNLLKAGKLINPDGTASDDTGSSSSGGYQNGYAGGMAGDGTIYAHGLDVSSWQGENLDFNAIKNGGYDYVILRAGTTKGKDTCFETYYANAKAAGLDVGAYYYSYATTADGAKADADNMLSWISGKKFEYPLYFDYEDPSQDALSTTTAQNICLTFMDALADAGYLTGLYTSYYKSTLLPMDTICAKYEFWVANYYDYTYETLSPTYSTKYGMYQYTNQKYVGSNGPYDANVAYKDYPTIVKKYGFNGYSAESSSTPAYLNNCTYYPSYCQFTTTKATPINSLPCSATSNDSTTLETAAAETTYTAIGLYKNVPGNLWYMVKTSSGETGYIFSGHTTYVKTLTSDIKLTDYDLPNSHIQGNVFYVTGKIKSTYNQLNKAKVFVYNGFGTAGGKATGGKEAVTGNSYLLDNSTIDNATAFGSLATGEYTYIISANYTSYYAAAAKELASVSANKKLKTHYFMVISAAADQSTCSHANSTTVLKEATCTTEGTELVSCSKCGLVVKVSTPAVHTFGDWTVTTPATCTTDGTKTCTCTVCGAVESSAIAASGHKYVDGTCTACGAKDPSYVDPITVPTLTGRSFSLSFESEILVNFYYAVENTEDITEQGMLVFYADPDAADFAKADEVYTGSTPSGTMFINTTTGIAAKEMGDSRYYCAYAKLTDGTYAYSPLYQYSPKKYATNMLANSSTSEGQKALCVAMLNYGAAAQTYFGYKTDDLMNAGLTDEQKALVKAYDASYFQGALKADANKTGIFASTGGFSGASVSVSFEGAFAINFYFQNALAVNGDMRFYIWTSEAYEAADVLTAENASQVLTMVAQASGAYWGQVSGIAAKNLDETYYVAAVYTDESGNTQSSGVIGYSLSQYCLNNAKPGKDMEALAGATAMYGYCAKEFFAR